MAPLLSGATTCPVRKAIPPLAVLVLLLAAGCVRQATREVVGADLSVYEPSPEHRETRSVDVPDDDSSDEDAENVVVEPSTPPAPPPPRLMTPDPVLFRIGAGYGALGRVDLAACRDRGLQAGYLHMRVTFRDSGRVVRAAVESPVAPPPEALTCIGERLKLAMVPVFEGGEVTLSKNFFVN